MPVDTLAHPFLAIQGRTAVHRHQPCIVRQRHQQVSDVVTTRVPIMPPIRWFRGGDAVDAEIKQQFGHDVATIQTTSDYDEWLTTAPVQQAVAGIILMDQFSRNIHRGTAAMYALDPKALSWSKTLLVRG